MARRAWCCRVHSGFTPQVKVIEAKECCVHQHLRRPTSGQLRFL